MGSNVGSGRRCEGSPRLDTGESAPAGSAVIYESGSAKSATQATLTSNRDTHLEGKLPSRLAKLMAHQAVGNPRF